MRPSRTVPVLFVAIWLSLVVVAALAGSETLGNISAAWFFLGIPVLVLVAPWFVGSYTCPGCHEQYECVGVWRCSCGYQDHRERHVLRFKCPMCKGRVRRTDCKRCGATIFL